MRHIKLYEEFPIVVPEPAYENPVFKVQYKSNTDLSNKRGNDTIDKPENDVLDNFAQGDIVTGKGVEDGKSHKGRILRIEKTSKGENLSIFIEEDGQEIEVLPSSVAMEEEIGNAKQLSGISANALDNVDQSDPFAVTAYESDKQNNSIKKFDSFIK